MTRTPSVVSRPRFCFRNRSFTSRGSDGLATTSQCSTALDATLFTFWPPGPPERAKVNWNSLSGIWMFSERFMAIFYGVGWTFLSDFTDRWPGETQLMQAHYQIHDP